MAARPAISAPTNPPYGYGSCVLSARGLELLKATPQSDALTETLGDRSRLVAEGSMELAKDAPDAIAIAVPLAMMVKRDTANA